MRSKAERRLKEITINPINQALPSSKLLRREERGEGRAVHPPRQQWLSEEGRGVWVDPTIIAHGVEFSIAGGGENMVCGSNYCDQVPLYKLFKLTTLTLVTHNMCHMVI